MRASRWFLLLIAFAIACVLSLGLGTLHIPPAELWRALTRAAGADPTSVAVVRTLRLPRMVVAALVGAGLGMSGAALQGALRNGLAEPYLLGVSGGAATGAVIAVSLGAAFALIPIAAFGGAVVAVLLTLFVAHASGMRGDPRVLIMAGVVVGAFTNAAIMVVLANAPASAIRGALWWMMGSVSDATFGTAGMLAAYVLIGGIALVTLARQIDILALGDEAAAGLGLDVDRATRNLFMVAALLAASTVAAAGLVGFVGLVVPHLARLAGARRHRQILLASVLIGATLVVGADLIARVLRPPAELPLGAVTALLGVPFFLAKLRKLT
jgi:iron complex transport system permease protein